MMPKGSKMDGKWSQNASRNHEKMDTKFDAEKGWKKYRKNMKNGAAEP